MVPNASLSLLLVLATNLTLILAGNCFSAPRDPQDPDTAVEPASIWAKCKHRPAQWACSHPEISFPTVECLAADMKTCGTVGTGPSIFYSFGATTVEVRTGFRDKIDPRGVMWNDALDEQYLDEVLKARQADFRLDLPNRLTVYTARYAEALATVASGEVFFAVKHYDGDGGGKGAYQLPDQTKVTNVWRAYEFPTLQRNKAVTKVTSIDISKNNNKSVIGNLIRVWRSCLRVRQARLFLRLPLHVTPSSGGIALLVLCLRCALKNVKMISSG